MGLDRGTWSSAYDEEMLWLDLDCALEHALVDPDWARTVIWWVYEESADFSDARTSAEAALSVLWPSYHADCIDLSEADEARRKRR